MPYHVQNASLGSAAVRRSMVFVSGLATLLQHRVEVRGRIDAFLHERAHEVVATSVLTKVIKEHVGETVMRPRGVEIGPVVELRVRGAQVHLAISGIEAIVPFAEDGLPLVEPDGGSPSRVELDHVTEL